MGGSSRSSAGSPRRASSPRWAAWACWSSVTARGLAQHGLLQRMPAELTRAFGQLGGVAGQRTLAGGQKFAVQLGVGDAGPGAVRVLDGAYDAVYIDYAHRSGAEHAVEGEQSA